MDSHNIKVLNLLVHSKWSHFYKPMNVPDNCNDWCKQRMF